MRYRFAFALVSVGVALLLACGNGSPSSSSGQSSSGASSSGASSSGSSGECNAECVNEASVTFDEVNDGNHLVGTVFQACYATTCASGTLTYTATGPRYTIVFTPDTDGGSLVPLGTIAPSPADASSLRITVLWTELPSPADGDAIVVSASSNSGPALFSESFTASYKQTTVCGMTCEQFATGP